ncbi:MAG: superoxide dismutase family protein [Deltaproteobacteria bacterium]|nr:superoxide dismutase family protein [Deltaproteobacteria bacterium]
MQKKIGSIRHFLPPLRRLIAATIVIFPSSVLAQQSAKTSTEVKEAIAILRPLKDSEAAGTVKFIPSGGKIRIQGSITGLTPGKHGFHVHEYGDCSSPDGQSAGGHFAPFEQEHGAPKDRKRHVGDLGNIEAGPQGNATVSIEDEIIALQGAKSIVGRSLVVHSRADDLTTQPAGSAGERIACGVIGIGKKDG